MFSTQVNIEQLLSLLLIFFISLDAKKVSAYNQFNYVCTCYNLLALKLDPSNVNILLDRAALCYQMGDRKKALECYEAALKVIQSCTSR